MSRWTKEDILYLKEWYGRVRVEKIAETLKRNRDAVITKAKRLGVSSRLVRTPGADRIRKLQNCAVKLVGTYLGADIKTEFLCPYCQTIFLTTPNNVLSSRAGELQSCGCVALKRRIGTKDIPGSYLSQIRYGAKTRGFEYSVTNEYLQNLLEEQDYKCALSGRVLLCGYINKKDFNASLDRIDSSAGYVIGNVQWLDKTINMIKNSFGHEEFIGICKEIYEHQYNRTGF